MTKKKPGSPRGIGEFRNARQSLSALESTDLSALLGSAADLTLDRVNGRKSRVSILQRHSTSDWKS